ncbi:MAG: hypothetical protein IT445_07790 [Phycisphaeraceae bacterium]|nr:hypothetical protein [Phycisphaeraceae bacterium]
MLYRSLFLFGVAFALVTAGQVRADGRILFNDGRQIYQAPGGVGEYHDGIAQLHGPRQEATGLGDRDDVVELVQNHMVVLIDPDAHYLDKRPGRMDQNHSFLRAQRLYAARHALPTRVIRRADATCTKSADQIKPSFILFKPDYMERRHQSDSPRPMIPSVPRPSADKAQDLMVLAR